MLRHPTHKHGRARSSAKSSPAHRYPPLAGIALAILLPVPVWGADLYHSGDLDVRWDNTVQYTAAFRLLPRDPQLISEPNYDDGDRNFAPGVASNRFDALSELELTDGDFGLRVSAAGWYDSIYRQRNDNDSPATFNPFSVPHNEFTQAVRVLHGLDAELDDAFVHGSFLAAGIPVSFRAGRYTLAWGESIFFGDSAIAGAQSPADDIRELEEPSAYARQIFLPVWQTSATLQPLENLSLSFYYQFQWRKDRIPGSGSYFSYADFLDAGGERYILAPGQYLYRTKDLRAPASGQFGFAVQYDTGEFNLGLYAIRFNAKEPEVYYRLGDGSRGAGTYQLVYPAGIELYGASFSTYIGDSNVAGEISARRNMPLASTYLIAVPGTMADADDHPLYPLGDVLYGQISTVNVFPATALWERADINAELAATERLDIARNASNIDPSRTKFALAFQVNFTPQYFEVFPGLDLGLPIGWGYGLIGRSSTDETQNAGAGTFDFGVSAKFRSVWQGSLTYTRFLGPPLRQPLADRDFVLLRFQRTF